MMGTKCLGPWYPTDALFPLVDNVIGKLVTLLLYTQDMS